MGNFNEYGDMRFLGAGAVSILPNASGVQAAFTAAETGTWLEFPAAICAFQTVQSGTGSAVVEIHGSNNNTVTPSTGTLLGTLTTSSSGDSATLTKDSAVYKYKLAKVTTLTATSVTVTAGA